MTALSSLWLPILLSSVLVFIASSVIHMFTPMHKGDFRKVPDEDRAMDVLRPLNIPPGDYMMPRPASASDMKSAEFLGKRNKGPVMIFTVHPNGPVTMGSQLFSWFLFSCVVGVFAAYVTGRALPVGAPYLSVFRFSGTIAFVSYSLALWPLSIWYRRSWGTTIRSTIDGLIYGLLTAGCFGWLWPR
jgi:hypothetical protein